MGNGLGKLISGILEENKKARQRDEENADKMAKLLLHGVTDSSQSAKRVRWQCTYCGSTRLMGASAGRPSPLNCPRRKMAGGKFGRHVWTKI